MFPSLREIPGAEDDNRPEALLAAVCAAPASGEFPKGKRHKRNPSFISLAFLFCFDIIYGITFNLGQKKQETFSDFPLSKTVKFF